MMRIERGLFFVGVFVGGVALGLAGLALVGIGVAGAVLGAGTVGAIAGGIMLVGVGVGVISLGGMFIRIGIEGENYGLITTASPTNQTNATSQTSATHQPQARQEQFQNNNQGRHRPNERDGRYDSTREKKERRFKPLEPLASTPIHLQDDLNGQQTSASAYMQHLARHKEKVRAMRNGVPTASHADQQEQRDRRADYSPH